MSETFLDGKVTLLGGDCLELLPTLGECSIDSCVTDPPYHLTSIVKRFGGENAAPAQFGKDGAYARASKGFMGKQWDGGDIAFRPELWAEVLRVLKPGAHLLAFSGTRTYHRMACAIEDAGFEVRDQLAFMYGSGFPKNHNIGGGWGTALKPAWEPCVLARKPLSEKSVAANVLKWGTGAINVDECRIATSESLNGGAYAQDPTKRDQMWGADAGNSWKRGGAGDYKQPQGRWPANLIHDGSEEVVAGFPDDEGISAARFFYTAKADTNDRLGSKHPTVKPLDLIQYLSRLITPRGGIVLDPFAGTGTLGEAAFREGFSAILIEREQEYQSDIVRRMGLCLSGPDERKREAIKASGKVEEAGPLFA